MKTLFIATALLALPLLTFYSCESGDIVNEKKLEHERVFNWIVPYDIELYGPNSSLRDVSYNTCSCSVSPSSCSASKTCTAPASCTCECVATRYITKCSCGPCSVSGMSPSNGDPELYFTETQMGYWNEFQDILDDESSSASTKAQGFQYDALTAVANDDYDSFGDAKDSLGVVILDLTSATKTAINDFYDYHGFTDDRL